MARPVAIQDRPRASSNHYSLVSPHLMLFCNAITTLNYVNQSTFIFKSSWILWITKWNFKTTRTFCRTLFRSTTKFMLLFSQNFSFTIAPLLFLEGNNLPKLQYFTKKDLWVLSLHASDLKTETAGFLLGKQKNFWLKYFLI